MSIACLVLPRTWIIWVIRRSFQWVIWWQRRQVIKQDFDILSWRVDTFLFLRVLHCGFVDCWSWGICWFFIHANVHFSLFLLLLWFFLCFPNFFFFCPSFFLTLKIFFSFLSCPHCIILAQYLFQSLLILVYHEKNSRSLCVIFSIRVIIKSQFAIVFFKAYSIEDLFKQRTW